MAFSGGFSGKTIGLLATAMADDDDGFGFALGSFEKVVGSLADNEAELAGMCGV